MALIACPECRHQVSTLARACPSCGAPIAEPAYALPQRSEALVTPGLLGRLLTVLGAWLVVPWVARTIVAVAGIAMLIVMFSTAR